MYFNDAEKRDKNVRIFQCTAYTTYIHLCTRSAVCPRLMTQCEQGLWGTILSIILKWCIDTGEVVVCGPNQIPVIELLHAVYNFFF